MSTARGGATGRAINGKLYVAGGNKALSLEPLALTEIYDPATNSWSKRADMKTPRNAAGSAAVNGKLYVLGGNGGTRTNEMYIP
jgi:N-acetylneuraminic acid mutarotase